MEQRQRQLERQQLRLGRQQQRLEQLIEQLELKLTMKLSQRIERYMMANHKKLKLNLKKSSQMKTFSCGIRLFNNSNFIK
jgi:hypothetical protein